MIGNSPASGLEIILINFVGGGGVVNYQSIASFASVLTR